MSGGLIVPNDLAGWWCPSIDATGGILPDRSGRNNHGTLTNMDPATDLVISGGKGALDLDGFNDTITTGQDTLFDFAGSNSMFSLSGWFVERSATNRYSQVVSKNTGGASSAGGYSLTTSQNVAGTNSNQGHFVIYLGASAYLGVDFDVTKNTWFHLVAVVNMTLSGTARVEVYRNGLSTGSKFSVGSGTSIGNNSLGLRLGSDCNGAFVFDGQLDDIRIYNRALTAGEVRQLWQIGRGNMPLRRRRRYAGQAGGNRRRRVLLGAEC